MDTTLTTKVKAIPEIKRKVKESYKRQCKYLSALFAIMYGDSTKQQREEFEEYFGYTLDKDQSADKWSEIANDALCNYGLSIDYVAPNTFTGQRRGYLRWQISWGGPSTEWRFFYVPGERTPYRIEYWFMDWFEGAHVGCTGGRTAKLLWDWLEDIGTPSYEYDKAMKEVSRY